MASFSGNVVISTEIIFSPQQDYDQAGLMIRLSDKNWIKFSLELEPDKTIKLGTTVTSQGVSDWSGEIIDDISMPITLIAEISSGACLLSMRYGDGLPNTVRITSFIAVKSGDMWAGIYAACPRQSGFVANFENTSMRVIK
ncbi:DUF1349 domain-containing protein [Xenorhabdus bovienii]|uniref:DUF1349 domain-containing protein n=1 Tax=Xenorhabdus bovienii TaxID=40576 RepID=UPI001EE00EF0|nr:DUF1349 domain-containing protein [Xenorhabdus bovienii]MCG3470898.1 DUF1349 domain-containing protein [Xenorhabdus bovienii]